MEFFIEHINNWVSVVLMLIGFFGVIAPENLVKKMMGLAIFQVSVLLFYISMANVVGGQPPILLVGENVVYSNPLPHVLMLTAIVVGVAVFSVGLAIIVRIKEEYGSIEERDILEADLSHNREERDADNL